MKVGGTASITAITQIITMVLMGFLVGQMAGNKWTASFRVILSISSTTIILKTFEELGVKLKICGNSLVPHCSGYCSHLNDGSIIYRGSKSTIFRNRVSVVRAETDFLPNNLVCQRDIFHSYPTQKSQTFTDG
jgi:hypothetical protein